MTEYESTRRSNMKTSWCFFRRSVVPRRTVVICVVVDMVAPPERWSNDIVKAQGPSYEVWVYLTNRTKNNFSISTGSLRTRLSVATGAIP